MENQNVQKKYANLRHTVNICFTCTAGAGECLKLEISYRSLSFSICKRSIVDFDMLDSSIVSVAKNASIIKRYYLLSEINRTNRVLIAAMMQSLLVLYDLAAEFHYLAGIRRRPLGSWSHLTLFVVLPIDRRDLCIRLKSYVINIIVAPPRDSAEAATLTFLLQENLFQLGPLYIEFITYSFIFQFDGAQFFL